MTIFISLFSLAIGIFIGWKIQVWIYTQMVRTGRLVFKSGEVWIGSASAIEEVWKRFNADCLRLAKVK